MATSQPQRSPRHLLVIPSYNPGPQVLDVVRNVAQPGLPVWVMIDGSDDGTPEQLECLAESDFPETLRLFRFPENRGKGTVMIEATRRALEEGFTHLLSFDSDGQHPAADIPRFLEQSRQHPEAMVLGQPLFGPEAPIERVLWRRMANFLTGVMTLGGGIGDALFGMRVYPLVELKTAMESTRWARRFDFESEAAIRLSWMGVPAIKLPAPVRYLKREEGGVSHFRYGRDNFLLSGMFVRLLLGMCLRFPGLLARRLRRKAPPSGG